MNKRITSLLFSSILLAMPMSLQAQYHSQVWNPDNGNGTYTNPVIYADYSDPDVVAVGEDYYLTAREYGHQPSDITTENSTFTGATQTTASSW